MATGKKSFVLYLDQRGIFEKLTNEQAGLLIKHIYAYCADENPESDFITDLAFESIKQSLKRDLKRFEVIKEKRSEAGKKSANLRAQQKATNPTSVDFVKTISTNPTVSVSDSVSVSVSDNVNDNKNRVVPTFDLFLGHAMKKAIEKNINLDQSKVKTKYDSWLENGWKDLNEKPIKNWKVKITSNIIYWEKKGIVKADDGSKRNNYLKDVL